MIINQEIYLKQTVRKVSPNQIAQFVGGKGRIKNFQPNSGMWAYTVEIEMASMPVLIA